MNSAILYVVGETIYVSKLAGLQICVSLLRDPLALSLLIVSVLNSQLPLVSAHISTDNSQSPTQKYTLSASPQAFTGY